MDERDWEWTGVLLNYLDDLLEKVRANGAEWFKYNFSKEKIELLKGADIRKMAAAPDAVEKILTARAGYKKFVVVAYLEGQEDDFKWSLRLLENVAKKVTPEKSMPPRPKFIEIIFQDNA